MRLSVDVDENPDGSYTVTFEGKGPVRVTEAEFPGRFPGVWEAYLVATGRAPND